MRKTLLLIAGILFCVMAKAQIPNPGFEIIDSPGKVANWQPIYLLVIPTDSTCTPFGFDSLSFPTTEAHTGSYAYEMRVAGYCTDLVGGNTKLVQYDLDTFADQRISFTERVYAFTFFYKLFPVMGDGGAVQITLEEDGGIVVADAYSIFSVATAGWELATVPLTYYNPDTPLYLTLKFTLHTDSVLHYGTRFLIDDINHFGTTEVLNVSESTQHVKCFPVPAGNTLFVDIPGKQEKDLVAVTVTDELGRMSNADVISVKGNRMELNVADLPKGVYFLQVAAGETMMNGKFVK